MIRFLAQRSLTILLALASAMLTACAGTTITPTPAAPSPVSTPAPPLSPDTVKISEFLPAARSDIVDVLQADVDLDGIPEMIVLSQLKERQIPLQANVMVFRQTSSGVVTSSLEGNLGDVAISVAVRDVNKDGQPEIIVVGGAGAHTIMLNIFRWQNGGYHVIGQFSGDSGVELQDVDRDGLDEVIEGRRWYDRSQLREELTYHWSPTHDKYLERGHRLDFTFGVPEVRTYPEEPVLAYYLALGREQYTEAYSNLSSGFQAATPFDEFRAGFVTTRQINVTRLEIVSESATTATIAIEIAVRDEVGGTLTQRRFSGTWQVQRQAGEWKLAAAAIVPMP